MDILKLKEQHERQRLDAGLEPPSAAGSTDNSGVPLEDFSGQPESTDDEAQNLEPQQLIKPTSSAFTPLLAQLEASQALWESSYSANSTETASGVVRALETEWPTVLQEQIEELTKLREKIFPVVTEKNEAIVEAWGMYTLLRFFSRRYSPSLIQLLAYPIFPHLSITRKSRQ